MIESTSFVRLSIQFVLRHPWVGRTVVAPFFFVAADSSGVIWTVVYVQAAFPSSLHFTSVASL